MATVFNKAWIDALLNNADPSKRFRPMANSGGMRNFVTDRPDPLLQSFDSGGQAFIRDSVRNNKFLLTGDAGSTRNNGIINGLRCAAQGVYIIDRSQNIIGILSSSVGNCGTCSCNSDLQNMGLACSPLMADPYNLIWVALYANDGTRNGILLDSGAYLYPIPVDQESVYAKLVFNNAKDTVQGNMVNFDFAADFKDQTLNYIPCSSFTDWTPSMIRGLVDVCPEVLEVETTGMTVKLVTGDGNAVNPTVVQGLTESCFVITNVTDGDSVIALETDGFSESPNGTYIFDFLASDEPADGDVLKLTITKNGYDFTCVTNTVIVTGAS